MCVCVVFLVQVKPRQVALQCRLDRDQPSAAVLKVSWKPPADLDTELDGYTVSSPVTVVLCSMSCVLRPASV